MPWTTLDRNPATAQITASGGALFQRHRSGSIWRYTGTPMTGWQLLDANPSTVSILAAGRELYQRHRSGAIWRYTGTPMTGWQLLDDNPATIAIAADGGRLYQLHREGAIWRYTGTPMTGWQLLDANRATRQIVAGGGRLFQLHDTGRIWRYTGTPMTGWQLLDDNPATTSIVADQGNLFQLHRDGTVWRFTGTPMTGWSMLGDADATVELSADLGRLYRRSRDGRIERLASVDDPNPRSAWSDWSEEGVAAEIAATRGRLLRRREDGTIDEHTIDAALEGSPTTRAMRVHIRHLRPAMINGDRMIQNARRLFRSFGLRLDLVSEEPMVGDPNVDVGWGIPFVLSPEHDRLTADRRAIDSGEIVIYFVGDIEWNPPLEPRRVLGYGTHAIGRPAVVVAPDDGSPWTLAHEIGHAMGLGHADEGCAAPTRLMTGCSTSSLDPIAVPRLAEPEIRAFVTSTLTRPV